MYGLGQFPYNCKFPVERQDFGISSLGAELTKGVGKKLVDEVFVFGMIPEPVND